jgi:hypothetical protein
MGLLQVLTHMDLLKALPAPLALLDRLRCIFHRLMGMGLLHMDMGHHLLADIKDEGMTALL